MKKRIAFITSGIIISLPFILPLLLFGVFNTGSTVGLLAGTAIICYGVFYSETNSFVKKLWQKKLWRTLLCLFIAFCIGGFSLVLGISAKMISAANNSPDAPTTAVVLGCMVYPHGPSLSLRQRLDAAYEFLTLNPDAKCILSGGKGENEPMSEASAMEKYLLEKGIAPERLYREEKSTDTRENILFSKEIIEKEMLCQSITIITNDFHQYRAQQIAKEMGVECYGISAKSHFILFPCYYLRELCAILAHKIGIIKIV